MEKRRLGRTNHMSSTVIVGAAAFSNSAQEETSAVLDLALARGVNHIDVAPSYGHAEEVVGPWLDGKRDQFFLGCKTLERDAAGAWAELNQSFKNLRTDKLDLYQLHAVTSFEELERAMRPGGSIDTLKRAKDEGLTRYLGITGHGMDAPAVQFAALQQFDFDTVMFPIHPRLYADKKYRADAEKLLNLCQQRDLGVQIIKSITRGAWGELTKNYHTWYQPYDTQAAITEGVRFALSQPGVASVPSAGDTRLFPMVLNAADAFTPMSAAEQETLIQQSSELELMF
jgi:aryl-alcohol dehydrogenase-like predicted oxidoreductase